MQQAFNLREGIGRTCDGWPTVEKLLALGGLEDVIGDLYGDDIHRQKG